MRGIFSALFLLFYLVVAAIVVMLVVHNTHSVILHTFMQPPTAIPLYLLLAISFFSGLGLGLMGMACGSIRRYFSRT